MTFKKKLYHPQFNIRIGIADRNIFHLEKVLPLVDFLSSKSLFTFNPVVFNADPFLFVNNNRLYLFYEEQKKLSGKGVIKMTFTDDMKRWSQSITVLAEKYHLSYPNVFRCENDIYMLPETAEDYSVKLYKSNPDFTKWTQYKTLLSGKRFVDSSILFKNEVYYLFTTVHENDDYKLMLYTSKQFDGPYEVHPQSPVAFGNKNGRCGGSVFEFEDVLYRPTQLCNKYYGEGLTINRIEELSINNYKEKVAFNRIIPNKDSFYAIGGHHISYCYFNNKIIVATDGLSRGYNFWEIARRIKNRFKIG